MRPRIGVIGQSGPIAAEVATLAEAVGRELARRGAVLLCGGGDGVMEAACRGARAEGGLTVGILPGDDPAAGNPYLDLPLTTGLDFEWRSLVLVHACDAVIVVAGAVGTLVEVAAAYHNGVPIVALLGSGGWAERLREAAFEGGRYLDARRTAEIRYARDPVRAVEEALELAEARRARRAEPRAG